MSKLTKEEVNHIAKLANLPLTEEETEMFIEQLSEVLDYVGELDKVDTNNIEPTAHPTGISDVTREDEIIAEEILPQEKSTSQANTHNGYFSVPRVLTKEG